MDQKAEPGAAEHQPDPLLHWWPEQPQLELQTLAEVMNGPGGALDWLGPDLGGPQGEAGLPPAAPPPAAALPHGPTPLPHGGGGSSNQLQALLHPQQMPGMQPMQMGMPGGPDAVSGALARAGRPPPPLPPAKPPTGRQLPRHACDACPPNVASFRPTPWPCCSMAAAACPAAARSLAAAAPTAAPIPTCTCTCTSTWGPRQATLRWLGCTAAWPSHLTCRATRSSTTTSSRR